jgi:hypothetical protein
LTGKYIHRVRLGNFCLTLEDFLSAAIVRLDLYDDITVVHANVANLYYQLVAGQYHADEVNVISARNQLVHIRTTSQNLRTPKHVQDDLAQLYILASSRTGPQTVSDGSVKRCVVREVGVTVMQSTTGLGIH